MGDRGSGVDVERTRKSVQALSWHGGRGVSMTVVILPNNNMAMSSRLARLVFRCQQFRRTWCVQMPRVLSTFVAFHMQRVHDCRLVCCVRCPVSKVNWEPSRRPLVLVPVSALVSLKRFTTLACVDRG